ncbi:group II intron reverse transcriptase/maturase [Brassicibacter mesophilus]|uniref:group II intron reverse transcriptase/maturase n=1 Tax=Brassicibacter mesophilus TaxID=745119 RepID=UPI003D1903C2
MHRTKETNTRHVGLGQSLQTSLYGIERKATRDKNHKFQNLYRLLNRYNLSEAWRHVNKRAAYGIDKKTAKEFQINLEKEIKELEKELINRRYKSKLIKRIHIEKPNGGKKSLGLPVVRDKLLQTLCKKILEAIYEPIFTESRNGYRRNRGAKKAVKDLGKELNFGRYGYVVEADIKGFFDNMSHAWIIKMLEEKIADKQFIRLIKKWLKAGVMTEENKVQKPTKGTPQGGVISPILANIYLHYALDIWFEKIVKSQAEGQSMIISYADDFVCAFQYKRDAEKFMISLERRLKKFNLELSKEKTRLVKFTRFKKKENGSFDFLGFTYRWEKSRKGKDIITHKTSVKKFKESIETMKKWIKEHRNCRLRKMIDMINVKLRGYYNYYGVIGNWKSIWKLNNIINNLLYKWLNRRSQRRSFNYVEFKEKMNLYNLQKPFIKREEYEQLKFSC